MATRLVPGADGEISRGPVQGGQDLQGGCRALPGRVRGDHAWASAAQSMWQATRSNSQITSSPFFGDKVVTDIKPWHECKTTSHPPDEERAPEASPRRAAPLHQETVCLRQVLNSGQVGTAGFPTLVFSGPARPVKYPDKIRCKSLPNKCWRPTPDPHVLAR